MRELRLTRDKHEPRLYTLDGVGTLRFRGFTRKQATATAGDTSWDFRFRNGWKVEGEAARADSAIVATLVTRAFRRAATLTWSGRTVVVKPRGAWKLRWMLTEGGRSLGWMEVKTLGGHPVHVFLEDEVTIEPGFLLFLVFNVRAIAMARAAGAAAVVAAG